MMKKLYAAIIALFFAATVIAQTANDIDAKIADWSKFNDRAETAVEDPDVRDSYLETVRKVLVEARTESQTYVDANTPAVSALRDQISALTAAVSEGEEFSSAIADKKATLEQQLAKIEAPVLRADIEHDRAEAAISNIDGIIRARFSQTLTQRSTSPLSMASLGEFASGSTAIGTTLYDEISSKFRNAVTRKSIYGAVPFSLVLLGIAYALLFIVPRQFIARLRVLVSTTTNRFYGGALHMVASFGDLILGIVAVSLVQRSLTQLGLFGFFGKSILDLLTAVFIGLVWAFWLSRRYILVHNGTAHDHRLKLIALTSIVVIDLGLGDLVNLFSLSTNFQSAAHFVLVLTAAPIIWILTRPKNYANFIHGNPTGAIARTVDALRAVYSWGTLAALILSALGYYGASFQLFTGLNLSLGLLAAAYRVFDILVALQTRISNPSELGSEEDFEELKKLWPVILGTVLGLATMPLFGLIWGMRVTDLQELWVSFNNGIKVGDVRLSATSFLQIFIVFFFGYAVVKGIQRLLGELVLPRTRMDSGGQSAIISLVGYAGYTLAFFTALSAAGVNFASLAVIFGALSVGIGFGLQNIVSNFISGIILLVERPIKKGDWIKVAEHEGYVRNIAVRSTEIETFDRASVIVPNADLISNSVINWVHSTKTARVRVPIGVGYDSDPREVQNLLLEVIAESQHALRFPQPVVFFMNYGDSSMNFEMRFFIQEADYMMTATSEVNYAIYEKLKAHNIEIPFPQREIRIKND